MEKLLLEFGFFATGLALVAVLYHVARSIRSREKLPASVQLLTKARIHYSLAGLLLGALFPSALYEPMEALIRLFLVFLGGWFGLVAGCGLDLRVLRRGAGLPLILEGVQTVLVAGLVLLAFYLSENLIEGLGSAISGSVLLVICGMSVLGSRSLNWFQKPKGVRGLGRQGSWQVSLTAFWGVLLVGMGSSQLNMAPLQIDYPFLAMGKSIVAEGIIGELLGSLVLGGMIGVVGDLLIRDVEGDDLFYRMMSVVLLGSGVAASVGLDPVWGGMVSGLWLINATLHRLDIIEVLKRATGSARSVLFFLVGWLLGSELMSCKMDWGIFFWVISLLLFLRPVARLGVLLVAHRSLGRFEARMPNRLMGNWLIPDELALVIAAGISKIILPSAGLAVLGAVLAGYVILLLVGGKVESFLSRLQPIAGQATGER